jgi:hypothetical protein
MNRLALATATALLTGSLLLVGCFDTDDDDSDCVGTMEWTFEGTAGAGAAGMTCALSQGPTFITVNTTDGLGDENGGADWQITFSAFAGTGTFDIENNQDFNLTGHAAGDSWWAVTGTITVDTWADPSLTGSFDVQGENADESDTMSLDGTFDVTVAEYVE